MNIYISEKEAEAISYAISFIDEYYSLEDEEMNNQIDETCYELRKLLSKYHRNKAIAEIHNEVKAEMERRRKKR